MHAIIEVIFVLSFCVYVYADFCYFNHDCNHVQCPNGIPANCQSNECTCPSYLERDHHCTRTTSCQHSYILSGCNTQYKHCVNHLCQCINTTQIAQGSVQMKYCNDNSECTECGFGRAGVCTNSECSCCFGFFCSAPSTDPHQASNLYNCRSNGDCGGLNCKSASSCQLGFSYSSTIYGVCYCLNDNCHNNTECQHLRCDGHHYAACEPSWQKCYCAKETENFCSGNDVSHCHAHQCPSGSKPACLFNRCSCVTVPSTSLPTTSQTTLQTITTTIEGTSTPSVTTNGTTAETTSPPSTTTTTVTTPAQTESTTVQYLPANCQDKTDCTHENTFVNIPNIGFLPCSTSVRRACVNYVCTCLADP